MKRFFAFLLAVLCVCSCGQMPAFAATTPVISMDTVETRNGKSVTMNITISGNPGIVATLVNIEYDSTVMTLIDVKNGDVFAPSFATFGNDYTATKYTMHWMDALNSENYSADGTLATLTFNIRKDAPTCQSVVRLTYDEGSTFNKDLYKVEFTTQNGTVNITHFDPTPDPIPPKKIEIPQSLSIRYKENKKLIPVISPENADVPELYWSSSNSKVVEIKDDGTLITHKKGKATIKVTTPDGRVSDTCEVTVTYAWWQALIVYFLLGNIWYLK